MKWLRLLGVAALAGVVATGVVVVRSRRWQDYGHGEIRRRLHERHERAAAGTAVGVDQRPEA